MGITIIRNGFKIKTYNNIEDYLDSKKAPKTIKITTTIEKKKKISFKPLILVLKGRGFAISEILDYLIKQFPDRTEKYLNSKIQYTLKT